MTTREYFQTVLDAHLSAEMDEASTILIQKLDERNEKRKATPTKEQKLAAARKDAVRKFLSDHKGESFTREAIAAALTEGENVVSGAQVTAAVRALGDAVNKAEVKIDKARRVVYSIAE